MGVGCSYLNPARASQPDWLVIVTKFIKFICSNTCTVIVGPFQGTDLIGASVSEPLSSDISVNFVCLSVCHGPSTYCKSLPTLILRILHHALIQKPLEIDMNHGQSNSAMATTRTEPTRGLTCTYSMARAIDIAAWQSVDAIVFVA